MPFKPETQAGLPPISRAHKAGLILMSQKMGRKLTTHLEIMIDVSCRAQGIDIKKLSDEQIANILQPQKK
jgi:hypothetical protein